MWYYQYTHAICTLDPGLLDGPAQQEIRLMEEGMLWEVRIRKELDQLRRIDVHVVVHLHHQLGRGAVLGEPLERHHMLVGHVPVDVVEVALHEVPVNVVLPLDQVLPVLGPGPHGAQQEDHPQGRPLDVAALRPRAPDDAPLLEVGYRRVDQHQDLDTWLARRVVDGVGEVAQIHQLHAALRGRWRLRGQWRGRRRPIECVANYAIVKAKVRATRLGYLVWTAPDPAATATATDADASAPESSSRRRLVRWRGGTAASAAAEGSCLGYHLRLEHRRLLPADQPDDQAHFDADDQQAQRSLVHSSGFLFPDTTDGSVSCVPRPFISGSKCLKRNRARAGQSYSTGPTWK